MIAARKPRRRWLRYSLITLLVLLIAASIATRWVARRLDKSARQNEVMEVIVNAGGRLRLDFQIDESGNRVANARIHGSAWLRYWTGDDLGSNVVEAEVTTDNALQDIAVLPNLRILDLSSERITDAGLRHVEAAHQLKMLCLMDTRITERGILKIRKALPNCKIVR